MTSTLNPEPKTTPPRQKPARRTGWFRRLMADVFFVSNRDGKWWLVPLILILLILAAVLALATIAGPIAPFLYPLL